MKSLRAVLTVAAVVVGKGVGLGATYYVATNGSHTAPFDTWEKAATNIHEAVALAVNNGDVILVGSGTFPVTNTLTFGANVTLRGVNGPSNTILNVTVSDIDAIQVSGAPWIEGLTIRGVTAWNRRAIVTGWGHTIITNCIIRDCSNGIGGFRFSLYDTLIENCNGYSAVGFSLSSATADQRIERVTVRNCTGTYTSGAYVNGPATIDQCQFISNSVYYMGGGIRLSGGAVLMNSLVISNRVTINTYNSGHGGGIWIDSSGATIINCTIAHNWAVGLGGGIYNAAGTAGRVTNTIIYANTALIAGQNFYGDISSVGYSCSPDLTPGVNGNITDDPLLAPDYTLLPGSPCIDSGRTIPGLTRDLAGNVRPQNGDGSGGAQYDMGCYEAPDVPPPPFGVNFSGLPRSGLAPLSVVFTASAVGSNITVTWYGWDFDNDGSFELTGPGLGVVTNVYAPGRYSVRLVVTNEIGESASTTKWDYVSVVGTNLFVSLSGSSHFPYGDWTTAATNLHDAVAVAVSGCTIRVWDGIYMTTGRLELAGVTLRGENGASAVTIRRNPAAGTFGLLRLDKGAVARGVTLADGDSPTSGGGVYVWDGAVYDCVVTNCRTSANLSTEGGGGIRLVAGIVTNTLITHCTGSNSDQGMGVRMSGGHLLGCTIRRCTQASALGGGIFMTSGTVSNCLVEACETWSSVGIHALGGTVVDTIVRHCTAGYTPIVYLNGTVMDRCQIISNTSVYGRTVHMEGGSWLGNSLIASNRTTHGTYGYYSGVYLNNGRVINCTIAHNQSAVSSGAGLYRLAGTVTNCIIYYNTAASAPHNYSGDQSAVGYSCAPDLTHGVNGNITNAPAFKDPLVGNYRLSPASPCRDTGVLLPGMTTWRDLDLKPRVQFGGVDMGAYESPPPAGTIMVVR